MSHRSHRWLGISSIGLLIAACGPSLAQRQTDAASAVEALRAADFEGATHKASELIAKDKANPYAHLVLAISRYRASMHQLTSDLETMLATVMRGSVNSRFLEFTLLQSDKDLALVDADLAVAAGFPSLTLDLCIACWKVDWNRNGSVDDRDEHLLEIEIDEQGKSLPDNDPRRRPTFRFDHGDVLWARAFVSFQRALVDLVLAYDWSGLADLRLLFSEQSDNLTLKLVHPERVAEARKKILAGLGLSDEARRAYLAETDDEREWVPNPRQKSHPLPLPVDSALFETWEQVVGDLRRLVTSEEGIDVAEVAQLGDHVWKDPPKGYIDVGSLLSRPKDIVINKNVVDHAEEQPEAALRGVFGASYVPRMKATPLLVRMLRMKREMDHGGESLERKLRYLFWIN
jgi:hypothetical protein